MASAIRCEQRRQHQEGREVAGPKLGTWAKVHRIIGIVGAIVVWVAFLLAAFAYVALIFVKNFNGVPVLEQLFNAGLILFMLGIAGALIFLAGGVGALLVAGVAYWYFGKKRMKHIPIEVFVVISVLLWAVFILARVLLA